MRDTFHFHTLVLGLALLMGGASFSVAQGLPGGASSLSETHTDWTVDCIASDNGTRCAISQTQVSSESGQRALSIELAFAEDGASVQGVLLLPFGLRLDEGVKLAIDDAPPFSTLRFSTCLPTGCQVSAAFDQEALGALRAGNVLTLEAVANQSGQSLTFSVSLRGMTSALNRMAELVVR